MLSEYFESANSFTYNGINSLDMGLFITGQSAADSAAEPEIETVEVPAKGILIQDNRIDTLDNQRFKDYEQKYTCCVDATQGRSLEELAHSIYMWLYAPGIEYSRLYDTYNTERYRLAYINSNASVSELAKRLLGEIEITFMCKAYERRMNGDKTITLTYTGSSSTYLCDYFWLNTGIVAVPLVGGDCAAGLCCGACVALNCAAGAAGWGVAPGLSCKMPNAA